MFKMTKTFFKFGIINNNIFIYEIIGILNSLLNSCICVIVDIY